MLRKRLLISLIVSAIGLFCISINPSTRALKSHYVNNCVKRGTAAATCESMWQAVIDNPEYGDYSQMYK